MKIHVQNSNYSEVHTTRRNFLMTATGVILAGTVSKPAKGANVGRTNLCANGLLGRYPLNDAIEFWEKNGCGQMIGIYVTLGEDVTLGFNACELVPQILEALHPFTGTTAINVGAFLGVTTDASKKWVCTFISETNVRVVIASRKGICLPIMFRGENKDMEVWENDLLLISHSGELQHYPMRAGLDFIA